MGWWLFANREPEGRVNPRIAIANDEGKMTCSASVLAMRGAPARAIQELPGHMDLSTTQRYMHLSPAAVEAAIRLLETSPHAAVHGDIVETEEGRSVSLDG